MKDFISGLFHFVLGLVLWTPCHPLRRLVCKCLFKHFDWSSAIYRNTDIRSPYRISIGKNTVINKKVLIDGRGGNVIIGNNVDIAQEVNIWTEQHDYNSPNYKAIGGSVKIEDYAWIASRATILPGVSIGYGAVVASCAVVTKDVPPLAVVAGVPAQIIGHREDNFDYFLECRSWFR